MTEDTDPVEAENVKDKYKPGNGQHPCPECGCQCDVQHSVTEFSEYIYCTNCKMKFTRSRKPVVEDEYKTEAEMVRLTSRSEKDEYVAFKCYKCDTRALDKDYRIHEKTVPQGSFEPLDTGIMGYDETSLVCPCGERHNGYLEIGEKIDCDCGRTYELSVD